MRAAKRRRLPPHLTFVRVSHSRFECEKAFTAAAVGETAFGLGHCVTPLAARRDWMDRSQSESEEASLFEPALNSLHRRPRRKEGRKRNRVPLLS